MMGYGIYIIIHTETPVTLIMELSSGQLGKIYLQALSGEGENGTRRGQDQYANKRMNFSVQVVKVEFAPPEQQNGSRCVLLLRISDGIHHMLAEAEITTPHWEETLTMLAVFQILAYHVVVRNCQPCIKILALQSTNEESQNVEILGTPRSVYYDHELWTEVGFLSRMGGPTFPRSGTFVGRRLPMVLVHRAHHLTQSVFQKTDHDFWLLKISDTMHHLWVVVFDPDCEILPSAAYKRGDILRFREIRSHTLSITGDEHATIFELKQAQVFFRARSSKFKLPKITPHRKSLNECSKAMLDAIGIWIKESILSGIKSRLF